MRILISDDHEGVRRGIAALLSRRPDWEICAEAVDGIDAVEKAKQFCPEVVLMDISMPRMDGLEATKIIRRELPQSAIIIVTQNDPAVARQQAADVGAHGFVSKSELTRDLLPEIERISTSQHKAASSTTEEGGLLLPSEQRLFSGPGVMAGLMRAMNWSKTPLGALESWSPALQMMVRFMLPNPFPQLLWWGPQLCCLYNDAYVPVLGAKHPWALGRPTAEVWREVWHVIGPLVNAPFHGGPATWLEDIPLEVNRNGFVEETHFTVAYSPVPDDTVPSRIGGVLATVHEISQKVVGDRRVILLKDLGARSAEPKSAEEACTIAAQILERHSKDVPFALFYLIDEKFSRAYYVAGAGMNSEDRTFPRTVAFETESADVLAQREMEKRRSPLVSIPPFGRGFSRHGGLSSDDFSWLSVCSARGLAPALLSIGPMSPPGYPSAWLHPCSARFRFARQDYCSSAETCRFSTSGWHMIPLETRAGETRIVSLNLFVNASDGVISNQRQRGPSSVVGNNE